MSMTEREFVLNCFLFQRGEVGGDVDLFLELCKDEYKTICENTSEEIDSKKDDVFHIKYKDGRFRKVVFSDIISVSESYNVVYFIDNKMDYPANANPLKEEDGSKEFKEWFERKRAKQ